MILKKVKIDCDFDYFLNDDFNQHRGSCISYQKREQSNIHQTAGGFPKSYHDKNTIIQQLWYDNTQVDFEDLGNQLGMEVVTVSTILQPPGNIITLHRDTFFKIKQEYPNCNKTLVRANIYLKDWEVGHIIQYQDLDNEWKNSTHWKQGEGFLWDSEPMHIGANIGLTNKYTIQISGFLNEKL
jgi:hypothetical protein